MNNAGGCCDKVGCNLMLSFDFLPFKNKIDTIDTQLTYWWHSSSKVDDGFSHKSVQYKDISPEDLYEIYRTHVGLQELFEKYGIVFKKDVCK